MFIETIQICKEYIQGENRCMALDNINLRIENPGLYVLQGPSGSGKTSFLNIIGNIDHPTKGEIRVLSQELSHMNDRESTNFRLEHLGYVFQQFNLIPVLTGSENIECPLLETSLRKQERQERLRNIITALEIESFVERKPKHLSGGQQQKIAIARSLVNNPKIILADEPTANLDSKSAFDVLEIFQKLVLKRSLLILISTHDQRIANKCTKIYHLKDGQLS